MTARDAVVVLGMHRSGTSLVTGLLSKLGLYLPGASTLYAPTEFNPRGNQEVMELTATNERLFAAFDGEWSAPPELAEDFADDPRAQALVGEASAAFRRNFPSRPWLWKDPRLCLLLPYWERLLAVRPMIVLVVRNPLETADSLARRDRFHPAHSVALWECYHRAALRSAAGHWVLPTTYERVLADPVAWLAAARERFADAGLQLNDPGDAAAEFADRSFRHSAYDSDDLRRSSSVSDEQQRLYEQSCALTDCVTDFEPPDLPPPTGWAAALLAERRTARAQARRWRNAANAPLWRRALRRLHR